MKLASVILDIPTQALDAPYTYRAPEGLDDKGALSLKLGCAVLVPFGRRRAVGFVIAVYDQAQASEAADLPVPDIPAPEKLKDIIEVLSPPYFDEIGAELARHLSERYLAPLSTCIRLFTPPGGVPRVVSHQGEWVVRKPTVGEVDDRWVMLTDKAADFTPRASAVKQRSVLDALADGELRVAELTTEFGSVSATLNSLEAKGVIRIEHRRRLRGLPAQEAAASPAGAGVTTSYGAVSIPKRLTPGQAQALEVISDAATRPGEVVLIDGVTGSGKTEVYLQAIARCLDEGKTALVLVPEISLTPQTVARFRGRFGDRVAVMHSRMSQGERYDQWDLIRSGQARVVVGARSALFTPLSSIGIIVIDEEHESSYKQESAPRYVSREVAWWLARHHGATLILGSATPSIESLYACRVRDDWHHVVLKERANGKPLPSITVVDMAREFSSGHRSMFSRGLSEALETVLRQDQKAILLLNQRGFAQFLLCRDCGFVPSCDSCSTSLTYHSRESSLMCHHCGHREAVPPRCPRCGSPYLRKFGAGTQRLEDELRALLSSFEGLDARIVRMDADTTRTKGSHRKLLDEFMAPGAAVLLGTQMIAKGLDFKDVTLVGVVNADTMLKLPDFRSAERTFDLIEQVAGRAGRADLPGQVIVQTYWAEAPAIVAAARYERERFLQDELPKRRELAYPPYVRLANVLIWGKSEGEVARQARKLYDDLREEIDRAKVTGWVVLAATPCVLERLRGDYRWHIVIKAPMGDEISSVLSPYFKSRQAMESVHVAVDIDPMSLL